MHRLRAFAGLVALALFAASLFACGAQGGPGADPSASSGGDLFAVVTGNNVDALVGINVAGHTVTRLPVLRPNVAHLDVDGLVRAPSPLSVVLSDSTRPNPLVWTEALGDDIVAVYELDLATREVKQVDGPTRGVLPFLYEGKLAWASAPGDGQPRLLIGDGTFELALPEDPSLIVEGPGPGRITVVVGPTSGGQRILSIDVAKNEATELPNEFPVFFGIWADDETLVATTGNHLLTWSIDRESSPDAVAGLIAGPTLTTDFYPVPVAGGDGLLVTASDAFDEPWVEAFALGSFDPVAKLRLPYGFVTDMAVSGTTIVVPLGDRVTFIDLASRNQTTVKLDGVTQTRWVGR